ncbi:dicer-like protein 1 [Diplodia corticola]|uniref:Dicer-like protein 1 n=1 Tax=Diplodia corticola TaxID=236234 RepID=A0A1J9R4V1_9PEZI|nr:dicer-like protein 1 [Diplodia corticola]OJD36494.1 dicer-like protein 1 [Diplodia corticola]
MADKVYGHGVPNAVSRPETAALRHVAKDYDDSESDDGESTSGIARTISEKKRQQHAIFSSWVTQKAEHVTEQEVKETLKTADDDSLSVRTLLAKQDSNIIADPREYQLELFERAKEENVIAVLDTGSGKTLIAVLLLKHTIDKELEDRAAGKAPRISFFLVDSVTLVFQQFAVLETNLDQKVERFCGAMGCDLWSKQTWTKHFEQNMVLVCTAEVLAQCLMHSFINMEQINLLIFDEAHHAKKGHSYAKIIKDYYLPTDQSKRPKVFGMTASPVDAKVDVLQAASDLEALLHCRIATTANLDLLRKTISRPDENVVTYAPLRDMFETPLYTKMKERLGDMETFRALFESSKHASSQLGAWCSDMFWFYALQEEEAKKLESRQEQAFHKDKKRKSISRLDKEVERLREAAGIVKNSFIGEPQPSLTHLSSKVLELRIQLLKTFERTPNSRCIVFVERRYTARLLNQVFSQIGGPHLKSGMIVGSTGKWGDLNISFRQQVVTLLKFKKGELNCLFATSVAEEGLDIPDCNLVVRFDLYRTMIQYVQSRGRARHRNSRYLHMIEQGNMHHRATVMEARQAERVMRQFCEALPEDRLLKGNDADLDELMQDRKDFRRYTEPSTGANLTYDSSLSVIAHFTASLPRQGETVSEPLYIVSSQSSKFLCEIILPENSPIPSATGRPCARKAIAKRSAAFEICLQLRAAAYLDENLLPIYTKQLPAMRNARLALNCKKTNAYDMMTKPKLWENTRGTIPEELHITVIELPDGLDRPNQPLAILTRTSLPNLPEFPLFLDSGSPSRVQLVPLTSVFKCSIDDVQHLTTFTLRAFKDVFNKTYEEDHAKMSYWLAPVRSFYRVLDDGFYGLRDILDWEALEEVQTHIEYRWTPEMPDDSLLDKYLVDRWDGGRRFFTESLNRTLKPTDPVPADAVTGKKAEHKKDILNYSISLYKASRAKADPSWDRKQPVIEGRQVLHRRNMLAEPEKREGELRSKVYLCPEPLRISALRAAVVATIYVFPAIIHRIDQCLIALEACQLLDLNISPELALEAVTKDSDNTDEHGEEARNFRRGMGNNYERLEFMGDCFLKMATSIALFGQNPDDNEFDFHVKRMCLVCNQNLFETAKELHLTKYVRSMAFSRRTWYPDGLKMLEGKGHNKTGEEVVKHALGDKTVADVCEALIGAAYLTHNTLGDWKPENWDEAVKAVTNLVASPDHTQKKWSEYLDTYEKPSYLDAECTAAQMDLVNQVEREHPYRFRSAKLLRSAFVHPSYPYNYEKVPSYQRLEFLGDSLIDNACITWLVYSFPDKDPQWLTEHKMAMVSNKFLGAVCVKLGFHKHLKYSHSQVEYQIRDYVVEIREAEREAHGARDYWTTVKSPPKCLPDVVEAYVGALFVDSGHDFGAVHAFFDAHIKWYFEDISIYDAFAASHPVTRLHAFLHDEFGCADHKVLASELPVVVPAAPPRCIAGVMLHDRVVAEGVASAGKNAKVKAALAALDLLAGLPPFEFRDRFGCDCGLQQDGSGAGIDDGDGRREGGDYDASDVVVVGVADDADVGVVKRGSLI